MQSRSSQLIVLFLFLINFNYALAKDLPVQVRLFAGPTNVDPQNTNQALAALGLKGMESLSRLALEITYPVSQYLDVGARYTKRLADTEEQPADPNTDYSSKLDQSSILLLARVPFYKTDIVRADVFAGIGGSNTSFKIKSASQEGELNRTGPEDWFGSPCAMAGASVAVGFKWVYFVLEGGFESNKVDGFQRSGTLGSAPDTLDLSGTYFSVGLMFDGIPGSVN